MSVGANKQLVHIMQRYGTIGTIDTRKQLSNSNVPRHNIRYDTTLVLNSFLPWNKSSWSVSESNECFSVRAAPLVINR